MSFFDNINPRFFNPFCCKNRSLYFECISLLIEKSKEIPVLYETDARNCIILYLQNSLYSIETENIGEEISSNRSPQENASLILRYFRLCGWISAQEIGRSGDNIASVSAYCRKLIDALHRIFDADADGTISNHIFSIYEILKASAGKDSARAIRPYSNILVPLVENECDLKNELLILKDSIREIMRMVIRISDTNGFGQFLMKDEMLNRFFNDYFFIRKSGTIPFYISEIDSMLSALHGSPVYTSMIKEYVELKNTDEFRAKEIIDHQFSELEGFINLEYEQEIDTIDRRINTYYNLYSMRIRMVLSDGTNLEQELNRLLLALKGMNDEERGLILSKLADAQRIMSFRYVGRKSFQRRKRQKQSGKNIGIIGEDLSHEEIERLTDELLRESPDRYSMDRVKDHFDRLTWLKDSLSVEELGVHTRDDAMMVAAAIVYAGSDGFPYDVEFEDGCVECEAATIGRITISKRSGK